LAQYCSAEYHCNNTLKPVHFYEAVQKVRCYQELPKPRNVQIPACAVVIEIGPRSLLKSLLKQTLPLDCSVVSLTNMKADNQLEDFLVNLGALYQTGVNLTVHKLYPDVPYPVPAGTPMIAPLIKWDHSIAWTTVKAQEYANAGSAGAIPTVVTFTIDPYDSESTVSIIFNVLQINCAIFRTLTTWIT
jgi:fatty acid synthase